MKNLLVLLISSISCSTSETDPTIKLESDLFGEWEWLKTAEKGFSETPSTVGYTKRLNFLGNKMVEIYINDTLRATETIRWYYPQITPTTIHLAVDSITYGPVRFQGDSLILNTSFGDGPIIFYRRPD